MCYAYVMMRQDNGALCSRGRHHTLGRDSIRSSRLESSTRECWSYICSNTSRYRIWVGNKDCLSVPQRLGFVYTDVKCHRVDSRRLIKVCLLAVRSSNQPQCREGASRRPQGEGEEGGTARYRRLVAEAVTFRRASTS
jgi:hypothetical protein